MKNCNDCCNTQVIDNPCGSWCPECLRIHILRALIEWYGQDDWIVTVAPFDALKFEYPVTLEFIPLKKTWNMRWWINNVPVFMTHHDDDEGSDRDVLVHWLLYDVLIEQIKR